MDSVSLDLVPLSALQHYIYCPRQCALIHLEQTFDENLYTLRGHRAHERADEPTSELIDGVRIERALPLYSQKHGLTGKADVVEFRDGAPYPGFPYPVEYKVGSRRAKDADDVQLCAQALCLEEMFEVEILEGSLFYDRSKRRRVVSFEESLRELTVKTAHAIRDLYAANKLPEPVADARCDKCSLIDACMPFEVKNYSIADVFQV